MRRLAAFLVVGAALAALAALSDQAISAPDRAACGRERWAVKTLTDPSAAQSVHFRAKQTTVAALVTKTKPSGITYDRTPDGVENQVWRVVNVRLLEVKSEADDDYHLIIADATKPSSTMVVEFPDASCIRTAPAKQRAQMKSARRAFDTACGVRAGELVGRATITGVGFWDRPHAEGAAPNGIELHPVLSFRASSCRPK